MSKHNSRESSSSPGGTPYERALQNTRKANNNDAEILEVTNPGRAVGQPVEVEASVEVPTQASRIAPVPSSSNNLTSGPINTWVVEGESSEHLNHTLLTDRLTSLLGSCTHRASLFAAAIQRFEMCLQFFASACASAHPNGTGDFVATLCSAKYMADELFAPRRDYTVAVTMLRHFVAGLLQRLAPGCEARDRCTSAFNELSIAFEEAENAIRDTIGGLFQGEADRSARERLGVYMGAFKRRGKMLGKQQGKLSELARECLAEIADEGIAG
ncbi:hypothetical protein PMIN03_003966 [Paraphaeosphaeria minitans]